MEDVRVIQECGVCCQEEGISMSSGLCFEVAGRAGVGWVVGLIWFCDVEDMELVRQGIFA